MKNKLLYFENLRLIAIISVIVTHVVIPLFIITPGKEIDGTWWFSNVVHGTLRFAVPIMIMQSGALLLSPTKIESLSIFFKKRFSKVLLPFLFWNLIYVGVVAVFSHTNPIDVLLKSFSGSIFYHLWFIYVLFGLYLITPILRIYIQNASQNNILYFLILWFFITGINPLFVKFTGNDIEVLIQFLFGYIGYFVLGYYLQTYDIPTKWKIILYTLATLSIPVIIIGTYLLSLRKPATDMFFHEYLSITVMLLSIGIFIAAKNSKILNTVTTRFQESFSISRICFGVYLSHALILAILKYIFGIQATHESYIVSTITTSLITLFICFAAFISLDYLRLYKLIDRISQFIY